MNEEKRYMRNFIGLQINSVSCFIDKSEKALNDAKHYRDNLVLIRDRLNKELEKEGG